jgi:signal transduction histidine kinase
MEPHESNELLTNQLADLGIDRATLSEPDKALLAKVAETYATFERVNKETEAKVQLRTDQLIASTSRAYSFLDSIHKGFIMCDTAGEVVLTNDSVRHILALKSVAGDGPQSLESSEGAWTANAIDAMLQPELQLKELIAQCLATSQTEEFNEVNFGKRVLRIYLAPLQNEVSGAETQLLGVVILVEDITEQKVLERSKDEFLSIASHELRTPLTAIRGNASLIKKYYAASITDKDMGEMIDDIHESSARLIEIVNDFLDVAAIEQGKIKMNAETFVMQDLIDDVARELQHLCEAKGVALIAQAATGELPQITADKMRIKQVIINLVGNAVKFTEEGSITISSHADQDFLYTVITDTGRGMSEESQRLLFRKFQQAGSSLLTRDTTKGTGLGLYISKLIVELTGGKIGLDHSEPDKGSSFSFSLPLVPIAVAAELPSEQL